MPCLFYVGKSVAELPSFGQWEEGHPNFSRGACISLTENGHWKMIDCGRHLSVICSIYGMLVGYSGFHFSCKLQILKHNQIAFCTGEDILLSSILISS